MGYGYLGLKTLNEIPVQRLYFSITFKSFIHELHLLDRIPQRTVSSVNRSMVNCLHKNLPFQALAILREQSQLGFVQNIDEVTFALSLKACRGEFKLGYQIHGLAVSGGFVSYLTVSNSLMNLYCKSGHFGIALRIFENLSHPDIVSWNTILSGFEKSEDAFSFARTMNYNGIVFDPVTYTTVLSYCTDGNEFWAGLQLHSPILKHGLESEIFIGNALITLYSRWGRLAEARRVFDEMPKRDLVSWSAMVSGYAQEGDDRLEAVLIFINMMREGTLPDHVSLTGAISACGHEKNLELGRQVHGLTIKLGYDRHLSVGNVLISTYSKCEVIRDAKLVFQFMSSRNVVSWTTIISIDEDAISRFNEMRIDNVYPNEVTFIGLIHAITTQSLLNEGLMVHGLCIKANFLSESTVCNSLITMYAKFESIQESKKIFEELRTREVISWNALISGYAQNGMFKESFLTFLSSLKEMTPNQYTFGSVLNAIGAAEDISLKHGQRCHSTLIKLGLSTDPIVSGALLDMYAKRGSIIESLRVFDETPERTQFAWTAIISAYSRHGDYESVMSLLKRMEMEKITPDSITFLSVLTACCRNGMVDIGLKVFDTMIKDHHIEPHPEHYSIMVDMLGRAGKLKEAEELMNQIPGGPGLTVLQSLLGSCRLHGNIEIAEKVADRLIEMEPTCSGSYVLMSNLYAEKGKWEKVAEMRRGMRERGVRKEIGFSWVDVGKNNIDSLNLFGFSSGDKSHPDSEEICGMADFLGLEMKFWEHERRENKEEKYLDHN
ncbi:pentatricopeptide repeat-containing protein At4g32430, mitochondrial [Neltuma alba]|uniref:pentatricopeptide repeat-containing protein At4g32430, mitochondrial n=1 Tax=Neltuma alba TaxID=207710 RepID=UPI0010A3CAEA|nr:pentatricopeptide repeat-containing protein At4g32430, mitochondrial [Prosopis alba]